MHGIGGGRIAPAVYAGVLAMLAGLFLLLPTSFLPSEDQGLAQLQYTLPPGATLFVMVVVVVVMTVVVVAMIVMVMAVRGMGTQWLRSCGRPAAGLDGVGSTGAV